MIGLLREQRVVPDPVTRSTMRKPVRPHKDIRHSDIRHRHSRTRAQGATVGTAVIVEAVRKTIGKRGGVLAGMHAAEILGRAQRGLLDRAGIDPAEVEQVAGGCVTQAGEQSSNITRTSWLPAGLPYQTGCLTLDAQCGSAQQAAHLVAGLIAADAIERGRGGGVGAMSRTPRRAAVGMDIGSPRPVGWDIDLPNQYLGAERIAVRRGLTREQTDAWGLRSQELARDAWTQGRFDREVMPVKAPVLGADGEPAGETRVVERDEGPAGDEPGGAGPAHAGDRGRPAHGRHVL